jgi:hypothetical protein
MAPPAGEDVHHSRTDKQGVCRFRYFVHGWGTSSISVEAKTFLIDLAVSLQCSVGHQHFRVTHSPSPGLVGIHLHEHHDIHKQVQSWSEYYV